MRAPGLDEPVTVERIERALMLCAYLVSRDEAGRVFIPYLERLEAELARALAQDDPVFRARRMLNAYTVEAVVPRRIGGVHGRDREDARGGLRGVVLPR